MEARRAAAMPELLRGRSFLAGEDDPFEGWSPKQIQAFVDERRKVGAGLSDDPYEVRCAPAGAAGGLAALQWRLPSQLQRAFAISAYSQPIFAFCAGIAYQLPAVQASLTSACLLLDLGCAGHVTRGNRRVCQEVWHQLMPSLECFRDLVISSATQSACLALRAPCLPVGAPSTRAVAPVAGCCKAPTLLGCSSLA